MRILKLKSVTLDEPARSLTYEFENYPDEIITFVTPDSVNQWGIWKDITYGDGCYVRDRNGSMLIVEFCYLCRGADHTDGETFWICEKCEQRLKEEILNSKGS